MAPYREKPISRLVSKGMEGSLVYIKKLLLLENKYYKGNMVDQMSLSSNEHLQKTKTRTPNKNRPSKIHKQTLKTLKLWHN